MSNAMCQGTNISGHFFIAYGSVSGSPSSVEYVMSYEKEPDGVIKFHKYNYDDVEFVYIDSCNHKAKPRIETYMTYVYQYDSEVEYHNLGTGYTTKANTGKIIRKLYKDNKNMDNPNLWLRSDRFSKDYINDCAYRRYRIYIPEGSIANTIKC